tara:strand:- start:392 stop:772 length:381 start_codon:yes stop_codon:yes gene_type:complete
MEREIKNGDYVWRCLRQVKWDGTEYHDARFDNSNEACCGLTLIDISLPDMGLLTCESCSLPKEDGWYAAALLVPDAIEGWWDDIKIFPSADECTQYISFHGEDCHPDGVACCDDCLKVNGFEIKEE